MICVPTARSADVLKANNSNDLNLGTSWSGGTAPTAADVGVWTDSVVGSNTTLLGADLSWKGIKVTGSTQTGTVLIKAGNSLTLGTSGIDLSSSARNLSIETTVVLGADQSWNVGAGRTATISAYGGSRHGLITGSGNLTKTGAGVLYSQNPANTFTGTFTLSEGILKSTNFFSQAGDLVLNGGTRVENGSTAVSTITGQNNSQVTHVDGNVTFVGTTGGTSDSTRLVFGRDGSPAMNLRADVEINVENEVNEAGGGYVDVYGFSEDGSSRSLTKTGVGTLRIAGNTSTHTGGTFINAGILDLAGSGGSRLGATSDVTVQGGTLNVSHPYSDQTMGVLTLKSGSITGSSSYSISASSVVLESGQVSFTLSGTSTVTKNTAGTVTMSGTQTYTGATTVNAGTLLIQGDQTGTGSVTVQSDGALGGDGSIAGSLSLLAGADFVFSLTETLSVNGATVSFGGFDITNLVGLDSSVAVGTYTLINGSATFNFDNVSNLGAGNAADLGGGKSAYFQSGSLQVVVVPEPGTWVLLTLGLLLVVVPRRLRRLSSVAQ